MGQIKILLLIGLLIFVIGSCGSGSRHTSVFLGQQADQNRRLAELQHQWQEERKSLYDQRDALEQERARLASERQREPIIAALILRLGELGLCLTPLALCWVLLKSSPPVCDSDLIAETLLLTDVIPESRRGEPRLSSPVTPTRPAVTHLSPLSPPHSESSA